MEIEVALLDPVKSIMKFYSGLPVIELGSTDIFESTAQTLCLHYSETMEVYDYHDETVMLY